MKKAILFAMLVLMGTAGLYAQNWGGGTPPSPQDRADRMMSALTQKVEVTDDQKTQLTAIFKDYYEEQSKNRGDWDKMKELAAARDEKVKAVLADDAKYEAYTKFIEEQMARRRPRNGGN